MIDVRIGKRMEDGDVNAYTLVRIVVREVDEEVRAFVVVLLRAWFGVRGEA